MKSFIAPRASPAAGRGGGFILSVVAVILLAAAALLLPSEALAATLYWVGADGANTNVASNWKTTNPTGCGGGDAGAAPGATDSVVFDPDCDNGATINANLSVIGFDMQSGYTGTVTQASSITITTGSSAFTVAGGTFTGGNSTITIGSGGFTISGGTFTSTTGTLSVEASLTGGWTHTAGGTFTHNSGTVELGSGTGGTINVSTTETFSALTVSAGTWTISSGDTLIATGTLSLTGGTTGTGTLEAQGDVTIGSGFSGGTSPLTFSGTANQTFTDNSSGSKPTGTFTVNKSSGTVTLATAMVANDSGQDLAVTAGTLNLAGFNLTVNDQFTIGASGVLKLQGGETVSTIDTITAGGTVEFNGSGSYTTDLAARTSARTYSNLTFSGTGTWEPGGAVTVDSNLTVSSGTFDIDGQNLTVSGTFSNSGTLRLQGGETTVSLTNDTDSGTVTYDGTASYTGLKVGNSYYNLTLNGSGGTWTLNATLDVNNNLTISAGTLAAAGYAITLGGNWSNSGTYTHGSNTVTLDGTDQTISDTTTFYNLTKSVTTARTLTFAASATQTIAGTMTLNGAAGALLSLRSSTTGTQASINPQGTRTVSYLDVKDNNNTNSTAVSCTNNCTDSGNNTNWNFTGNTAPAITNLGTISQAADGSGKITFKATIEDANSDSTKVKVEVARDLGSWLDPDLDTATASQGSITVSNSNVYQIDSVDTDRGRITLTIIWKSKDHVPSGHEDASVYIRLTPNDGTDDGTPVVSSAFTVDNKLPLVSLLTLEDRTSSSLSLSWSQASETNFDQYTLCYGHNSSQVGSCSGTARVWGPGHDSALSNQATTGTTITGLLNNRAYYLMLRAHDDFGNVAVSYRIWATVSDAPLTPILSLTDTKDVQLSVAWRRLKVVPFRQARLCYGQTLSRVNQARNCDANGNVTGAIVKTFTSPTILQDTIRGLTPNWRHYVKLFVVYSGYRKNEASDLLVVDTCPAGRQQVNGVCVPYTPEASPSPSPTAAVSPAPTPLSPATAPLTASPDVSPPPDFTPEPVAAGTPTPETTPTPPPIATTLRQLLTSPREAIRQVPATLKPIVESRPVRIANVVTTAAAVVSVASSAGAVTSTVPSVLSEIPHALSRLWEGILGLFGFRRKRRPWGRVVDAASGEAVPGAYVQVFDHQTKKLQGTMVTNTQGAFSSLVPPGMYEFRVHKPGWSLTPQAPFLRLVVGEKIYDGKPVAVTQEKVLPLVLALHLTQEVPLTKHLLWRKALQTVELFIARLSWPLLIGGALFNSVSISASPGKLSIAIEIFYAILIAWKLHLRFKQHPAIGYIRDAVTGRPLDLALVRLYDASTGKLIETRTTSAEGKFLLLPSPGVYTISVVREGYTPHREAHVVVNPKKEALALAFKLTPLPAQQIGLAMEAPA